MRVSKFLVYEDEVIVIEGELYEGDLFLHCEYKKETFSKSMYTYLLNVWVEVCEVLKEKDIECVFSYIPKEEKLMKWQEMFGMSPLLETEEGIMYRRSI